MSTESFKFYLHIPLNSLPILKDTVQLLAFCLKKENVHYICLNLGLTRSCAVNAIRGLLTRDGFSDVGLKLRGDSDLSSDVPNRDQLEQN